MRESMKIMSLNWFAYSFSYYLSQFIAVFVLASVLFFSVWLPVKSEAGEYGNAWAFALGTLLFGMSLLSFSMWISTLFTDAKLSSTIGQLLIIFPSSITMAVIISNISTRF